MLLLFVRSVLVIIIMTEDKMSGAGRVCVEIAATLEARLLDLLPAAMLIGRVLNGNWVTHRIQTSRASSSCTASQRQCVLSVSVIQIAHLQLPVILQTSCFPYKEK
jgi:hypothetical protein